MLHLHFTRLKQVKANAGLFEKQYFLDFIGLSENWLAFPILNLEPQMSVQGVSSRIVVFSKQFQWISKPRKKIKIEVTSDRDHKTSVLNTDQSINIVYFSTSPLHFNVCG